VTDEDDASASSNPGPTDPTANGKGAEGQATECDEGEGEGEGEGEDDEGGGAGAGTDEGEGSRSTAGGGRSSKWAAVTQLPPAPARIGDRVLVLHAKGSRRATLRYFGFLEFSTGPWAGVEFDAAVGKHNGTREGKTYFTCAANHGSFVRPDKVKPLRQPGGSGSGGGGGGGSGTATPTTRR
jgi:hypothetical protein